jgi:hypothetical protein
MPTTLCISHIKNVKAVAIESVEEIENDYRCEMALPASLDWNT